MENEETLTQGADKGKQNRPRRKKHYASLIDKVKWGWGDEEERGGGGEIVPGKQRK